MVFEFTPYILPLIVSGVIQAALGIYAWSQRAHQVAWIFSALIVAVLIWTVGFAVEIAAVGLEAKIFWANVQYAGIASLPMLWLALVMEYTGQTRRGVIALLFVVALLTNIIAWTNDAHHLFRQNPSLDTTSAPFTVLVNDYGPWFNWVTFGATILVFLASFGVLLRSLRFATPVYRQQIVWLLVATAFPLLVNTLYILDITPIPNFNLTAVAFSLSGILIAWNLRQHRFLDLMPIARDIVIDSMDDAILVVDNLNRVVDLNPAARQLLRADRPAIISHTLNELFPNQHALIEQYRAAHNLHTEFFIATDDEGERHFDLRISAIAGRDSETMGRVIILHDITRRKQLEAEREQMIVDLDAFSHMVAHDLKNPLNLVLGFGRLLKDQHDDLSSAERHQYLSAMARSAEKMFTIINELLLLAHVRGETQLDLQPLDMAAIVAEVQFRLSELATESQAEICVPAQWPLAVGRAPWVEEVWANYLSNAIQYGGQPPRIELGATAQPDHMARFWVRDHGPGVEPELQSALFSPFTQIGHDRPTGNGLGLSIVRRIVERLGGTVGLESTSGQGSTFYFTLPLADPEAKLPVAINWSELNL